MRTAQYPIPYFTEFKDRIVQFLHLHDIRDENVSKVKLNLLISDYGLLLPHHTQIVSITNLSNSQPPRIISLHYVLREGWHLQK